MNVSNLVINPRGVFKRTGGTVNQSGLLTVRAGTMHLGLGEQRFGQLQLQAEEGYTNSIWYFPTGSCTVRLPASSNQPWSALATLLIKNWAGSVFGNGLQQIYFGSSAGALTGQQLDRILFENPPGLPPGVYTARLLDSGELVPDEIPPTGRVPPRLQLLPQADGVVEVIVQGEIGAHYSIERSSNLLNWADWTNGVAGNGTFSARDSEALPAAMRYYRAMLLP